MLIRRFQISQFHSGQQYNSNAMSIIYTRQQLLFIIT